MEWNFQKIEYFLRVTEEKSLSEAARKMFFTPQALNKHLRQLETELGVKLINRERGTNGSGEGMSLTLAGEQMKRLFMPCYQQFQEATVQMDNYLNHRKQRLRIAYFRGIKKNEMLMPLFLYLSESEEFESIELLSGELGEVLDWVEDETCDLAVTNIHDKERQRDELNYIPIDEFGAKILVSDKHPWADRKSVTAEEMARETMVILRWKEDLEKDNFWKNVNVKERKMVGNIDSLLAEVKTGKSFAVTVPYFEGDYDKSYVRVDLPEEYRFLFQFCLVFRKDNYFQNILEKIKSSKEQIWEDRSTDYGKKDN